MVVGPDWKGQTPAGIKKVFQSSTQFAAAIYRTQLFNPADMPNVIKVQAGYAAQPLSAYLKQPAPPAAPAIDFPKIDKEMLRANFFDYLDFVLQFAPALPEEKGIRAKLATIGVGPGKTFSFKNLSVEHKAAILLAMKEGDNEVDKYLSSGMQDVNGWTVESLFGDRTFYQWRLGQRAAAAKAGIYGNDAVEACMHCPGRTRPAEALDGSKHKYMLTFAAGQIAACERLLVGDDVRRQDATADRKPDQSLPHQFTDAAGDEGESRWLADALHSEQDAGARQGGQLAACPRRPNLHGDASVLAKGDVAFGLAAGLWYLETSADLGAEIARRTFSLGPLNLRFTDVDRRSIAVTGQPRSCRMGRM